MTPSWVLFLLLMLVTTSLEWVIKVKKGGPVGMPRVRHGGFTLRRRGPMQRIPHRLKHVFSGFESSRRTLDRTNIDHFGGIGSGHQKDAHSQQYGQFNSDVSGCSGIESRRCSEPSDCAGCLGLYACNKTTQNCQLKGVSHSASRFQKYLENIRKPHTAPSE